MADFDTWTFDDAQTAITDAIAVTLGSQDAYDENYAFIEEHDHWQDGDAWVGPNGGSVEAVQTEVLTAVERQFTPRDAISEVLDRMANALLRQEPDVDFVPLKPLPEDASDEARAEQENEVAELRSLVSTWWDRKKLWSKARLVAKRSRWAGRAALRTWIAPGHLLEPGAPDDDEQEETGPSAPTLPQVDDFGDALDIVQLFAPEPDSCYVYTDEETQERVAIFLFEDPETEKQAAELWWVDDEGKTHVKIVQDGGDADGEDGATLPGLAARREASLDRLAEAIRRHLDVAALARLAGLPGTHRRWVRPGRRQRKEHPPSE